MESVAHHLWIGFAGGLLAFAHCLGMCGGFVVHLSQEQDRAKMVASQLLWQCGRICTYTLLGALAGYAGLFIQSLFLFHPLARNFLAYAAGGIIIVMGMSLLGLFPVRGNGALGAGASSVATVCGRLFRGSSPGAALSLGIATGFLPCPIVLAFLAYAVQAGSVISGLVIMSALGVGTMVPLLLLGSVTRLTGVHTRRWAPTVGGIILIVLGISTALRGTEIFHNLLGCPQNPILQQSSASDSNKPCCAGKLHANGNGK